mgnify:FL=1
MRLLIAAYEKASSGIASYTAEVTKLLAERKLDISLLSFDDPPPEVASKVNVIRFEVEHKFRALPILTFALNERRLKDVEKDFDVIFETLPPWGSLGERIVTVKWGYISYWRLAYIRTIGLSFPENLGGFPVTLQHYLMDRRSFRRARHIISFVDGVADFVPPVIERRAIKDYECNRTLKVLFVSRDLNMPRKNLRVVLAALKRVKRPVELHLIGRGDVEVPPGHKVINHGYLSREEVLSLMRRVDLQVLPSTYEELGFVGLEAYSVGLPLITSDIPSFRSVFRPSPKFDPRDPVKLAEILGSLSCDELKELGRKEWDYVAEMNEKAISKLMKIFNDIY